MQAKQSLAACKRHASITKEVKDYHETGDWERRTSKKHARHALKSPKSQSLAIHGSLLDLTNFDVNESACVLTSPSSDSKYVTGSILLVSQTSGLHLGVVSASVLNTHINFTLELISRNKKRKRKKSHQVRYLLEIKRGSCAAQGRWWQLCDKLLAVLTQSFLTFETALVTPGAVSQTNSNIFISLSTPSWLLKFD